MQTGKNARILATCSIIMAAILWSSSYAVTKEVLGGVGPLTIGAARFVLAAFMLHLMVRLRRDTSGTSLDARQRGAICISGLLGITVYFILENIGVRLSTASDASLIVATYPLMTMFLELVILRYRISLYRICGVLLAGGGAVLVVRNGSEIGGSARWTGDLLLLTAGLAWAGYNIMGKKVGVGQNALTLTYYQTLAGAAGFVAASMLEIPEWRVPSTTNISLIVYLAAACSVGGFLLYNYGLRRVESSVAVNILNLVPVCGVVGAVLINGENIRIVQVLGGIIIITGVSIGMVERKKKVPEPGSPERIPVENRA